jgi:hypothetical protein
MELCMVTDNRLLAVALDPSMHCVLSKHSRCTLRGDARPNNGTRAPIVSWVWELSLVYPQIETQRVLKAMIRAGLAWMRGS